MKRRALKVAESPAEYYDRRGVLAELTRRPVEFALDEELRRQILRGQCGRQRAVGNRQLAGDTGTR